MELLEGELVVKELLSEMKKLEKKMVFVSGIMEDYGAINQRLAEKSEELYSASLVLRSWIEGIESVG